MLRFRQRMLKQKKAKQSPRFPKSPRVWNFRRGICGRAYPYLHAEMGAVFSIADLVVSRAGASSLGEYPHFGIPAILVPYPHAWRYQKVNADYLSRQGAAITLADELLPSQLEPLILDLIRDPERRTTMRRAMHSLARKEAAVQIVAQLAQLAGADGNSRSNHG